MRKGVILLFKYQSNKDTPSVFSLWVDDGAVGYMWTCQHESVLRHI